MSQPRKSLLEVQFPIAQLSLESYIERDSKASKVLSSLGKWWGSKPIVLTRAIILASLFEASDDSDQWPSDLEIFLKLMCFDNAGMWKRKNTRLPAELCYSYVTPQEESLFDGHTKWSRKGGQEARRRREFLEKRVFYTLSHAEQREYCCPVEQIDGPPTVSWDEINTYCGTNAASLQDWVSQISQKRFGTSVCVGDAFSGMGSIPFEAAELGCDVVASDLNPVACLLTWGALNVIAGDPSVRSEIMQAQARLFEELDDWMAAQGLESSEEGWRSEAYLYCVEVTVPEWDGWTIPVAGSWEVAPKTKTWVELVPDRAKKRFDFKVRNGGGGFKQAKKATKQGVDIVCPEALWNILHEEEKTDNASRSIALSTLISNHGGIRHWEKTDVVPRSTDFYRERLYCIRWRNTTESDSTGNNAGSSKLIYREPTSFDLNVEQRVDRLVQGQVEEWQMAGWIPDWRIKSGYNTDQPIRERGWTHWHQLFTPRQLLMASQYSCRVAKVDKEIRPALILNLGRALDANSRLCRWLQTQGGGIGGTKTTFYNQALNTFPNYAGRSHRALRTQLAPQHMSFSGGGKHSVRLGNAKSVEATAHVWITDPPYADAVNYDEVSEFFLAWYKPHLNQCFPDWYTDSKRDEAVKGDDASFRVSMAECYSRLAKLMPDDGLHVLMFTHKDTDVWEDLALIMWSAGLHVKQVWSIATETAGVGIRAGNYVQATYNMVLRKRLLDAPMGFVDLVIPQINERVKEVITHMRDSQVEAGALSCGYTDTDYLLAAQAVAAEVVTGFSSIDGIDLDEELRTPNKARNNSVLRELMNQAKRTAVDFLVPLGLEEHLKRSPDGTSAYQFWRSLCPEEKFLHKGLELEAGGEEKIGTFQDLGRAYGIGEYEELLGPVEANNARTKLPTEFPRPDLTSWDDVPANERDQFAHCITRHLYHALQLLANGADAERAVKHLVDCTDFWEERHSKHLVLLGYLYQTTEPIEAWTELRPLVQTLRLAVENHRA